MHRILLYTLVVVLVALAWNARQDEVLAAARQAPAVQINGDRGADAAPSAESELARTLGDTELQARLEARVESHEELWARLGLEAPSEPSAEVVLAGAEAWVEANFPEGGTTARPRDAEDRREFAADAELGVLPPGSSKAESAGSVARSGERAGAGEAADEGKPVYLAALARIESLSGDVPAWFGLLDLQLAPGAARPELAASAAGETAWAPGDTAWISDESGNLLARVEALDGFGLELDPSWPWVARQRRLFWAEGGGLGLSARQYRLVLGGDPLVASWVGRLVMIRSLPPSRPPPPPPLSR